MELNESWVFCLFHFWSFSLFFSAFWLFHNVFLSFFRWFALLQIYFCPFWSHFVIFCSFSSFSVLFYSFLFSVLFSLQFISLNSQNIATLTRFSLFFFNSWIIFAFDSFNFNEIHYFPISCSRSRSTRLFSRCCGVSTCPFLSILFNFSGNLFVNFSFTFPHTLLCKVSVFLTADDSLSLCKFYWKKIISNSQSVTNW